MRPLAPGRGLSRMRPKWGQRLDMSPEAHLVHCVFLAEKDKHLPGGEKLLQGVLRDARGAGIAEEEIEAAIKAAETPE